jgi:hypothetical protein
MNEKEFIMWLHGFLEISEATTLNERQLQIIKDHLDTFFTKVTPERKQEDDDLFKQIEKYKQSKPITLTYYPPFPESPYKITCSDSTAGKPLPNSSKTYC